MRPIDVPPFDFAVFIAERYGIHPSEAEMLIAHWVAIYRPVLTKNTAQWRSA
jgi:hypothetical protein